VLNTHNQRQFSTVSGKRNNQPKLTMNKKITALTFLFGIILITSSMGLLGKLFGNEKKQQTKKTLSIKNSHEEKWEIYFTNINDKLGSIIVDLGLYSIAPIKEKPNLVWVTIKMNEPRENGLISRNESELLGDIEDKLVESMKSKFNSVYAGRTATDGNLDLYFYLNDTTLYDKIISKVMVGFSKYNFNCGSKEDKNWEDYFNFLYPIPEQLQSIENRHVVEQLVKSGDKLIKAREVDHWLYFKNESNRMTFLSKVKNDGFIVVNTDYDIKLGTFPYKLHIKRKDKVDLSSVDEYTIYLWRLAVECNGEYDGWETQVIKD
jgi:uncharacterized protein (TIGR01619 family)